MGNESFFDAFALIVVIVGLVSLVLPIMAIIRVVDRRRATPPRSE